MCFLYILFISISDFNYTLETFYKNCSVLLQITCLIFIIYGLSDNLSYLMLCQAFLLQYIDTLHNVPRQ